MFVVTFLTMSSLKIFAQTTSPSSSMPLGIYGDLHVTIGRENGFQFIIQPGYTARFNVTDTCGCDAFTVTSTFLQAGIGIGVSEKMYIQAGGGIGLHAIPYMSSPQPQQTLLSGFLALDAEKFNVTLQTYQYQHSAYTPVTYSFMPSIMWYPITYMGLGAGYDSGFNTVFFKLRIKLPVYVGDGGGATIDHCDPCAYLWD